MAEERSKTGNGAFWLRVNDDGSVDVASHADREINPHRFPTVQEAHDFHTVRAADLPSHWNISYHLEDFLA